MGTYAGECERMCYGEAADYDTYTYAFWIV